MNIEPKKFEYEDLCTAKALIVDGTDIAHSKYKQFEKLLTVRNDFGKRHISFENSVYIAMGTVCLYLTHTPVVSFSCLMQFQKDNQPKIKYLKLTNKMTDEILFKINLGLDFVDILSEFLKGDTDESYI